MKRFFQPNRSDSDKPSASKPREEAQQAVSSSDEEANAKTQPDVNKIDRTVLGSKATPSQRGAPAHYGRYEVRRSLGAGGYGDVFLGHDDQLDRPVAIKVLRPKSPGHPSEEERS